MRKSPFPARPLDRFSSLKMKLGVVIVVATATTVAVIGVGVRAGLPLIVCGVLAGLISLGMIQMLARGMTSPLRDMAAATDAMARGEYGRRVADTSRDEVGELARAFNKMAAELAEVDRMRRDLVANVSHELRTPISALQAGLENLVDGVEPASPDLMRSMLDQAERLGRLVEQLLDLSRLESGAVPFHARSFQLGPLLHQVVRDAQLAGAPAPLEFEVSVEPTDLVVQGDPERVRQVFANLVHNAVRHSPVGGAVRLQARIDDGAVKIAVADQGPGIGANERARVFERFYRSDAARASSDGGSGLGLAIARWIVDMHGGRIEVDPAPQPGCRMLVTLPGSPS